MLKLVHKERGFSMQGLQKQFSRNWRNEAVYWWKMYLKQRLMTKNLRRQNKNLRKALFWLLGDE